MSNTPTAPIVINPSAAALSQTLTGLVGLVAATALSGPVGIAVTSILGCASGLLSAEASGGVTQDQWDAIHKDTVDVLAQINARRPNAK